MLLASFLAAVLANDVRGQQPFQIIATDKEHSQLIRVIVEPVENGIVASQPPPIKLNFPASSIAIHPDGDWMIISTSWQDESKRSPAVAAQITQTGEVHVGETSWLDTPTGYTSIDRTGKYFLSVIYSSGAVRVHKLETGGGELKLGKATCSLTVPHRGAHSILTTPGNRFAYVPCVKQHNALFQFRFDQDTGMLTRLKPFNASPPPMAGPRHVAFHPKLPIAYFSNEQQLGVSVYAIAADGALTDQQLATTIPRRSEYEPGKRDLHASDIAITPNGAYLFVAVRDFSGDEDSIFTFRIEADGKLTSVARRRVGNIPWKLNLSPDGDYLLVSEAFDKQLSIFKIHHDGQLKHQSTINWNTAVRDMVVTNMNSANN